MGSWTDFLDAAKEMNSMVAKKHEETESYSAIMGRTVWVCKYCREPKGSAAWEYPCRKAPEPKDDCDESLSGLTDVLWGDFGG